MGREGRAERCIDCIWSTDLEYGKTKVTCNCELDVFHIAKYNAMVKWRCSRNHGGKHGPLAGKLKDIGAIPKDGRRWVEVRGGVDEHEGRPVAPEPDNAAVLDDDEIKKILGELGPEWEYVNDYRYNCIHAHAERVSPAFVYHGRIHAERIQTHNKDDERVVYELPDELKKEFYVEDVAVLITSGRRITEIYGKGFHPNRYAGDDIEGMVTEENAARNEWLCRYQFTGKVDNPEDLKKAPHIFENVVPHYGHATPMLQALYGDKTAKVMKPETEFLRAKHEKFLKHFGWFNKPEAEVLAIGLQQDDFI